jgi:hypothetical protein
MSFVNRADKSVEDLEAEIAALEAGAGTGTPVEAPTPDTDPTPQKPKQDPIDAQVEEEVPLSKDEETFRKRFGDLRRHSQKKENEFKAKIAELEEKLKSPKSLPTNPDEVKAWVEKYPQVAQVIIALADERAEHKSKEIKTKLDEIETAQASVNYEKEQARIKKVHADFDEIVNDDFHDWVEKKPQRFQDMVYDGTADDVIEAITLYKESMGKTDPNREAAKAIPTRERSTPTTGSGRKKYTESQVDAMTVAEYEKHEEAIAEAIRSGNFVYDLRAAARA